MLSYAALAVPLTSCNVRTCRHAWVSNVLLHTQHTQPRRTFLRSCQESQQDIKRKQGRNEHNICVMIELTTCVLVKCPRNTQQIEDICWILYFSIAQMPWCCLDTKCNHDIDCYRRYWPQLLLLLCCHPSLPLSLFLSLCERERERKERKGKRIYTSCLSHFVPPFTSSLIQYVVHCFVTNNPAVICTI